MTESATRGCALAIMTKEPRAGLVKTRLSPTLTPEEAAELNRCFLRDMTAAIDITVRQSNAAGCAVYTPEGAAESYAKIIPPEFHLVPQRGDALGERIIFAMEDLFQLGFSSVCLIGSDSPTIPPRVFAEAVVADRWFALRLCLQQRQTQSTGQLAPGDFVAGDQPGRLRVLAFREVP